MGVIDLAKHTIYFEELVNNPGIFTMVYGFTVLPAVFLHGGIKSKKIGPD